MQNEIYNRLKSLDELLVMSSLKHIKEMYWPRSRALICLISCQNCVATFIIWCRFEIISLIFWSFLSFAGDWFNKLDFTMQSNNFGIGLPVATKNKSYWHVKKPILANVELKPTPDQIKDAKNRFMEFLQIRYSSPLFRLRGKDDVIRQLKFHNVGRDQVSFLWRSLSGSFQGSKTWLKGPLLKILAFSGNPLLLVIVSVHDLVKYCHVKYWKR